MIALACVRDDRGMRERRCGLQNVGKWAVVRQPQTLRKVACYDKRALYRFMVVGFACALVDEFQDKLFIRSLKTEEASASSASMLATPLNHQCSAAGTVCTGSCLSCHGLFLRLWT